MEFLFSFLLTSYLLGKMYLQSVGTVKKSRYLICYHVGHLSSFLASLFMVGIDNDSPLIKHVQSNYDYDRYDYFNFFLVYFECL